MLTQQELDQIKLAVTGALDAQLEDKVDALLDRKLSHLPSKEEFYEKMDEVMGELKAIREEQVVLSGRVSAHDDRLEKLEEIHPDNAHRALI